MGRSTGAKDMRTRTILKSAKITVHQIVFILQRIMVKIDYEINSKIRKTKNAWRFYGRFIFTGLSDQIRRELQITMPGWRVPSRLCTIEIVSFSQQIPQNDMMVVHKRMYKRISDYLFRLDKEGTRGNGTVKDSFATMETVLQNLIDKDLEKE